MSESPTEIPEYQPGLDNEEEISSAYDKREITASWDVPTKRQVFKIEFEHGTASGKRVLWINGKEVFRRDWMFRLVGDDVFIMDGLRCGIRVDPASHFKFTYEFYVNGRTLKHYLENLSQTIKLWNAKSGDQNYRIVLEKDTLNIYLNGILREETGEFVEGGTDTQFVENGNIFILKARTSGNKHEGLNHTLTINGCDVVESPIL